MSAGQVPSDYRVIAVAGASGGLGCIVSKELLKAGFQVVLLTSSGAKAGANDEKSRRLSDLERLGGKQLKVNYGDDADLKKALTGVHVVVSTLNGAALDKEQRSLIRAAKAAGVKRFVPSEFGVDTTRPELTVPFVVLKRSIQEEIKKAGLEYSFFFTGFFMDFDFADWYGFRLPSSVKFVGAGNTNVSFIHRQDVGRYVAEMLRHPDRSRNKCVCVAGDKATMNNVLDMMKKNNVLDPINGKVEHVNLAEAKERLKKANYAPETVVEQLQVMCEEGYAELKTLNNADYPDVRPQTLSQFIPTMKK